MKKECKECGKDMFVKWPKIAGKLEVCPDCCQAKSRKTNYVMSATARKQSNLA